MKERLCGGVLPTVVVVSVLMLIGLLGLLTLWGHEALLFARDCRLRQARADVESAYTLYALAPQHDGLTASEGCQLYDSVAGSRVFVNAAPWGLYDAVRVCTVDSLINTCRLFGAGNRQSPTLIYANNRSAVTLAGQTALQGELRLPQNGLIYGRVGSDFYRGREIVRAAVKMSESKIPMPQTEALRRVRAILDHITPPVVTSEMMPVGQALPDSLTCSFLADSTVFDIGGGEIRDYNLRGKIILYADEIRLDSTCRIEHLLVCARKAVVGRGARITAQLFASDTVIIEDRAVLEHPSGVYSRQYVRIGERAEVNGYVIVRDTVKRKEMTANYHQDRTARVRGLLYVDGVAQIQGIVAGAAVLRQAAYFSPQGYYKDIFYDASLLENSITVQPLWLASVQRKEALCVD